MAQILQNLFDIYPSPTCSKSPNDLTIEEHIREFSLWLKNKLNAFEPLSNNDSSNSLPKGRLGPSKVVFSIDPNDNNNLAKISKDKLTIQSQSAFCTLKANCCVFKGKWMYEVQLRSKGVMQIGWCSSKCTFTQDTGVGDTPHSYGFDGSKQRIWHIHTRKYGPYWRSGDIFGICLDMDDGKIEYYRNGVGLGDAFSDIERGPGIALFPAVSLAFDDSLTANFGGSPFRHPIDGYRPLQMTPTRKLEKAEFLLNHLVNVARVISTQRPQKFRSNKDISNESICMVIAALLLGELTPILCNSYIIEEKVFKILKGMCVMRTDIDSNNVIYPGATESTLGTFLSLFWMHLESDTMKCFLNKFVTFLSSLYRETPTDLDYEKQRIVIVVLTCICNHPTTRKYLLEFKFFKKNLLPMFLYIKPPDEQTLAQLLPDDQIWTAGLNGSRDIYLENCKKLSTCTDALYTLQKNLMEKLLNNTDADKDNNGIGLTPSSRKIFINKLRNYVTENSVEHRTIYFLEGHYTSPTQPAVALSFLCILLDTIKQLFEKECDGADILVPSRKFYDNSLQYYHFDRIGGVLSHLRRHYRHELVAHLGNDHVALQNSDSRHGNFNSVDLSDIYSAMFLLTGSSRSSLSSLRSELRSTELAANGMIPNINGLSSPRLTDQPTRPGSMEAYESLVNLLDCCVLYYYAVAHKYIIMIADLRDSIGILSEILFETKSTYDDLMRTMETVSSDSIISSTHGDVLNDLHIKLIERRQVFMKRSIELARKQAWYRSVALGTSRRDLLCWLLSSVFRTLKNAANEGDMFAFVPEFYINVLPILLDTVMDFSFHDLNVQNDLSGSFELIQSAAEFLSTQSANSRVVLASCKDALLQAMGTLMCHETGIQALENCAEANQRSLVCSLMRPYQGRAWGQSNWLLLRFWLGHGFAYRDARPPSVWSDGSKTASLGLFRSRGKNGSHTGLLHHIAPAYPSEHFQQLIRTILLEDEPFSTTLLNSVLSQLNWAFSEFVLLLQEIQNGTQRSEQHLTFETRQSKICSMCFELTVSLMRALEMLISIAPTVFNDPTRPNSDTLLNRVCQLISQVLSRVTVPAGCFQHVVDLCLPDLGTVTHFAIVTAVIGIILALLKDELNSIEENIMNVPRIAKMLLTDPSFQIACLEFTVGDVKTPIQIQQEIPRGNFDAQTRGHIDPLTNEVRLNVTRRRFDQPIIKFSLLDYPTHVTNDEIDRVKKLIRYLLMRKTSLSDITLPSEDTICTICYSKSISAQFFPCNHQSCSSCIIQHLMNNKLCFYCKTLIVKVQNFDLAIIYEYSPSAPADEQL